MSFSKSAAPEKSAKVRLAGDLYARLNTDPPIHPTAIIAKGAEIGSRTLIGPYSVIGPDVVLGEGNIIGPHVVLDGYTKIGNENLIYQFASVGAAPQDKKYHGEPSTLEIGNSNVVREYVTLQPGTTNGGMKTTIGDSNLFMANTHVGHDCQIGNLNVFANSSALAGHVLVENRVTIGGLAGIHQFVRIGELALVAAGAMATNDIPPFCIAQGDRACLVSVNVVGLQRAGYTQEIVLDCKRAFKELFRGKLTLQEALLSLEPQGLNNPCVKQLITFIKSSERGVASLRRGASDD